MTTIISWNVAGRLQPWRELLETNADVALLQEVKAIPSNLPPRVALPPDGLCEPWEAKYFDRWPTVVKLSDRVNIEWFKRVLPISETQADEFAVSGIGTIAAARVIPRNGDSFIAISMYARWIRPHVSTRTSWRVGYADGSAHRIMSDLSAFIGHVDPGRHRILAAGDLNIIYGLTEESSLALPARDNTVFDRMDALGMEFLGPRLPAGRPVNNPLRGLPKDSRNVPTYYTLAQKSARNANRQLDYAFASRGFHNRVRVRAINEIEEWGSSDHCRLLIEIE